MSFSFELLPDEPILIATMHSEYSIARDSISYMTELASIVDGLDQPVVMITDARLLKVDVFQEFLVGINEAIRGEHARAHSPNFISTIMVSNTDLMRLSIKGSGFGNLWTYNR